MGRSSESALLASEKHESARFNRNLCPPLHSVSVEPTILSGSWVPVGLGPLAVSVIDPCCVVSQENVKEKLKCVLVGVRSVSDDSDAPTNVVAEEVKKFSFSSTGES